MIIACFFYVIHLLLNEIILRYLNKKIGCEKIDDMLVDEIRQ